MLLFPAGNCARNGLRVFTQREYHLPARTHCAADGAHVYRYYLEADLDAAADMPHYLAWLSEKAGKVLVQSFEP